MRQDPHHLAVAALAGADVAVIGLFSGKAHQRGVLAGIYGGLVISGEDLASP